MEVWSLEVIALSAGAMLARKPRQVAGDTLENGLPVPARILPIKLDRAIPRAVVALQKPAPIGIEAIEDPGRLAERGGEVRRRGVDSDDEIEICDERRRVGEVFYLAGEVIEIAARPEFGFAAADFRFRRVAFLQAEEIDVDAAQRAREDIQGDVSSVIENPDLRLVAAKTAIPYDADLQFFALADSFPPRARLQIGRASCRERV